VTPSPIKKKLSLSDYTNRKKKIDAQKEAQASPLVNSTSADANLTPTATPTDESPTNPPKEEDNQTKPVGAANDKAAGKGDVKVKTTGWWNAW